MHDPGDNASPELHSLFILIYPTNHLFIHMIHDDDLCRINNATANAAISMAMEVLLCPLFVSGVVVERRAIMWQVRCTVCTTVVYRIYVYSRSRV